MDTHSSIRDLELYVDGHLSAKDSDVVRMHLEACEQCQLRLTDIALDLQWKGSENRTEARVAVNLPGRLKLLDPLTSVGPPHNVVVIEISRNGLKIRTPRHLLPKALVQIRFGGKAVLGEVRYCNKEDVEYSAGLKLVPDFPG